MTEKSGADSNVKIRISPKGGIEIGIGVKTSLEERVEGDIAEDASSISEEPLTEDAAGLVLDPELTATELTMPELNQEMIDEINTKLDSHLKRIIGHDAPGIEDYAREEVESDGNKPYFDTAPYFTYIFGKLNLGFSKEDIAETLRSMIEAKFKRGSSDQQEDAGSIADSFINKIFRRAEAQFEEWKEQSADLNKPKEVDSDETEPDETP